MFQYKVVSGFPLDETLFPYVMWAILFNCRRVMYNGRGAGPLLPGGEGGAAGEGAAGEEGVAGEEGEG